MVELFGKRIIFQYANKELKFPDLSIEFQIEFGDTSEANAGFVRFYNLAKNSISDLKKDKSFLLKAGYKNDIGILLPGKIQSQKTQWENVDKKTIIIVNDNTEAWMKTKINKTWQAGIQTSQIIPEIINKTGLTVGDIDIQNDIEYPKGKTFSTTAQKALQEIAKDTNSKVHASRGKVYFRPKEKSQQNAILINSNTGLISLPEINSDKEDNKTYTITTLLNYKIRTDSLLKVESKVVNGNFRVMNGTHTAEGTDFSTQVEAKKI